jgi:hypothetical protein
VGDHGEVYFYWRGAVVQGQSFEHGGKCKRETCICLHWRLICAIAWIRCGRWLDSTPKFPHSLRLMCVETIEKCGS